MDSYEGNTHKPRSLHKYLYCISDPINHTDPSGFVVIGGSTEVVTVQMARGSLQNQSLRFGSIAITLTHVASVAVEAGVSTTASASLLWSFAQVSLFTIGVVGLGGIIVNTVKSPGPPNPKPEDEKEDDETDYVWFCHGTSRLFADDINQSGVRTGASLENMVGSREPGAFFTFLLGKDSPYPDQAVFEFAQQFAKRQKAPWAIMIGKLPRKVFQSLKGSGLARTEEIGYPGSLPETIFKPAAFPTLDAYNLRRWIIKDIVGGY
jgi:hypothetical protein